MESEKQTTQKRNLTIEQMNKLNRKQSEVEKGNLTEEQPVKEMQISSL